MLGHEHGITHPFGSNIDDILMQVQQLTSYQTLSEEEFDLVSSVSGDRSITSCRILPKSLGMALGMAYEYESCQVHLTKPISSTDTWGTLLAHVKFSFIYGKVLKTVSSHENPSSTQLQQSRIISHPVASKPHPESIWSQKYAERKALYHKN